MATERIPAGDLGTLATVRRMKRYVNQGVRHPLTVSLARLIVEGAGGYLPSQALAIRSWLQSSVSFLRDPHGFDLLRTVPEMLDMIRQRGVALIDCDDVAILGAALGKAVGFPARFIVLAFEHPAAKFAHIYTELCVQPRVCGSWVDLDITRPPALPPISRIATFRV